MDVIPASIALAKQQRRADGEHPDLHRGQCNFWPMDMGWTRYCSFKRDGDKNHKILRFPILRASVKAYKNNLNTHKSYSKFREKRKQLRDKKRVLLDCH